MTLVTLVRLSKMTPKWGWYRVIAVVLLFLRHVQGIAPGSDTSLIYFAAFEDRMLPGATHRLSPPLQISISYCADICRLSAILASNSLLSTLELDFRQLVREDSDVINGTSVCRGFMYIRSSSVCIHVKGQLDERWDVFADLKQAKDTIYYEHSKDSKNLFESYKNSILGDKDAYQRVINNVTMEACAGECTLSSGASCNSFAYSKNMSTCGLSKIIASNVSGLMPVEEYSYFLYNGNWPCNVTLNYKYEPRVIASQSYPYVNANNVTCHFTIIAPPSQMVVLHVRKFFITSRECKPEMNSVTIFETNNANATESRIKEGNEIGKLCSEDQISDNLVLSSSTDVYVVIRQSLDAMATRITYHFANASSCTVNPCMNAGSCREDHNASYRCYCQPGYTGLNCQSRLSVCDSKPCLFGGQCIATEDSFLCQCPRGLTGTICDYFTGACYSGPCYNNGTCAPLGSSYTCVCQRGFTGRRCEYDINECFSSPCVHGKCIDHLNRYECECDDAFDGRNCDQDKTLSHCDVFNCRFGTCAFNATGKFCQCFPGFKGDTCNDDIDDCSGNPCAHGSCVDHVNSFECKCHTGFVGKHCDIPSDDPCRYNPCRKGHCSFKNGSFECKCEPGFTGSQCETPLTKCDYMCTNGFCLNRFEFEPTCFCFEGFMGQYCEERCTNGKCPSHHEMNSTSFNPNRSSNIFTSNNAVTKVDINTVSLPLKPTISVDDIILKSSMQSQFEIPASQSDLTRIETMTILGGSSSREKPRTQVLTYDQNPVISHIDTTPDTYITERQSYGGNAHVQSSAHILEPNLMLTSTHTVYSHSYKSESLKATDISASKSDMITSSKLLWSVKTLDHTDNVVTILTTPYTFKTSTEIAPTPVTGTDDAYTDYNQNIVETINVTHITSISTTTFPDSFSNRNQDLKMQSRMTDAEIGSFTAIPKSVNVVPDDGSKGHPMLYTIYSMNVAVPNYTDFASTEPQLHTTEYKTTINAQPPLASTQATSQDTGEDMSDLVKIESVLLGTLFLVLVIVVVGGACVMYRQRHRGAVYLGSQEPPVWNNTFPVSGRQQDTALKKRCSSRDIHKDYMQGNHITTPAVANGYYRRGYEDLSPDDDADDESSASKSSIDGYSTGVMPVVRIGKPVSGQIVSNGLPHVSHRKAHPGTDHYVTTPVIRIQKPEPGQIVSYGTTLKESKYRKQRQRSRPPVYSKPIRRMCSDDSSEHTSSEQEDCIYSVPYLSRQPNRSADDKSQIHYDVIETPVVMISKPVPGQLITWDSRNYDDSAYGGQQLSVENHTIGHDSKGDDNPADQRSLKEISPNKETPLHPVRLESQTAPNSVPHSTCSSNPFFKQNDGSLGLRLSNTYHRWSEGDLDDLLDEMMESENFNPYSRSRDTYVEWVK
ncbi:uncharacterized protein LOC127875217 isoform X2 [Dreissena polymorpha]|nr:uncharacterized protein LOC127875217 isoform X2 [Dreissena polymorpha]